MRQSSFITAVLLFATLARADEWPQFRGPTGQGHATESEPPVAWSETENVAWRTEIPGRGWSSPVVGGGQIWLSTALEGQKALNAIGIDLNTGKIVQNVKLFELPEN